MLPETSNCKDTPSSIQIHLIMLRRQRAKLLVDSYEIHDLPETSVHRNNEKEMKSESARTKFDATTIARRRNESGDDNAARTKCSLSAFFFSRINLFFAESFSADFFPIVIKQ